MRVLLTACLGTVALVASAAGPLPASAAGRDSRSPVGGARLTAAPTVVTSGATPPAVRASAYVVADLDTGSVLAAKAPHARLRPASTLKTLTALVLLPRLDKTDTVIGTDADAGIVGSKVGVYPGQRYSVDLLFEGLFLASGNDAVHALAEHDQGGLAATTRRMNQKAAELGALDTRVTDPTGLDADGQLSSAYDLALFARAGLRRTDFAKYAATKYTNFPEADSGTYQVANQNKLLFGYDGALGVKTGYTTLARNTFVGAARRNGHTLVVTLLNSPHGITADATKLLDWTFGRYDALSPVGTLVQPAGPMEAKSAPRATAAAPAPRSRPVALAPGQLDQSLPYRIPALAYAAPPFLLLALILRRPRTLRTHRRRRPRH